MVIQRSNSWRLTNDSNNLPSSSEDSNSSSVSRISTAENILTALKQRYSGRFSLNTQISRDSAIKSLDLLRANIQSSFDKEIDLVVKKFMDTYFSVAMKNVKENLGEDCITADDQIKRISISLLDHSKSQYSYTMRNDTSRESTPDVVDNKVATEAFNVTSSNLECTTTSKRKELDTESEVPQKKLFTPLYNSETFGSPILTKQLMQESQPPPRPKPIYWNTSIVGLDTQFVLDGKASRFLGLIESKEKLSAKHPELIRYMMDNQDKDWMVQQKIILPTSKNLKYLILVKEEVIKLAEQNVDYARSLSSNIQELQSFRVSEFIMKKIQRFFNDLNFRSRFSFTECSHLLPLGATPRILQTSITAPFTSSSSSSNVTTSSTAINKARSTLSSTHATLSALLSNVYHADSVIVENDT